MTCTYDPDEGDRPGSGHFDPAALDNDQLTAELCRWGAQMAASTCRFVLLAAELDRRESEWSSYGVPSCAHWLNWRCGLSLGAAREHIRVGHALSKLALVRRSFIAGEISYSKVRAVTRIATAKTEAWLLEMAGLMTAGDLERVCGAYRRVELEDQRREQAERARTLRSIRTWTTPEGTRAIYAELPLDEGAVVVAALEASLRTLREERMNEAEARRSAQADVSAEPSETPEAAGAAGTSGEPGDVPAETSPAWPTMADALVEMAETALAADPSTSGRPESARVVLHVNERVLEDHSNPGCCHIESVGVVPVAMAERLMCDSSIRTVRYTHGGIDLSSPTRVVPLQMHRALRLRDGGCRFPGCERRRRLHAHHVVWVSRGGPTEMSNLVYLCSFHHHLVHEGGWGLALSAEGDVTVRDPGGAELHEVRPPARPAGEVAAAEEMPYGGERFRMRDVIDALIDIEDRPPEVA